MGLDADPLVGGEFAVGQGVQTGFEVGAGHFSTAGDPLAQHRAGLGQPRVDRRGRDAQQADHLLVRLLLIVEQQDRLPVDLGELVDLDEHPVPAVAVVGLGPRRRLRDRVEGHLAAGHLSFSQSRQVRTAMP